MTASMRPPLNTGEDLVASQYGRCRSATASMRPPLNTGEDRVKPVLVVGEHPGFNEAPAEYGGRYRSKRGRSATERASMRPPLNTGEDDGHPAIQGRGREASMRPPLNTGEDLI